MLVCYRGYMLQEAGYGFRNMSQYDVKYCQTDTFSYVMNCKLKE